MPTISWPRAISPFALVVFASLYFTVVLNQSFWHLIVAKLGIASADQGVGTWLMLGQLFIFLFLVNTFLVSLIRFPYLLKPLLGFLLVIGAAGAYFMTSYGILIDTDMLRNVFQTDVAEAGGLLSIGMLAFVIGFGVLPAVALFKTRIAWPRPIKNTLRTATVAIVSLGLSIGTVLIHFKATAPFFRSHGKEMRWRATPLNLLAAGTDLALESPWFAPDTTLKLIAGHALISPVVRNQGPVLILVVGETARAQNFSLNGYTRPTNEPLQATDVISFSDVASCGTATATSLPCMFSRLGRSEFSHSAARYHENLLDIAQRAGYHAVWIDNQSGSKGVADRVEFRRLQGEPTVHGEVNDLAFIAQVRSELESQSGPLLLVLHQMGSHGPEYFKRTVPEAKVFLPECMDKQLEKCTVDEIVNAYDNTIVNTSLLLAGVNDLVLEMGSQRPISMLYLSDHGESLGEHGLYLHGMPYRLAPEQQTKVPLMFWANQRYSADMGLSMTCLRDKSGAPISHDNLFDAVLGLLRINTDVYKADLDPFSACRSPVVAIAKIAPEDGGGDRKPKWQAR